MWWTPVIIRTSDGPVITPMRYHCRPAGKPKWYDRKFDGLYNARSSSLENFWRDLFGSHHALIVISGFYENVERHRLEGRELAPGEPPQNVVLNFRPQPPGDMYVPCVWSHWRGDGEELRSMALITDSPPEEVAAAGHDRCPISLRFESACAWLRPQGLSTGALYTILGDRERPYYEHQLLAA
jgi:putative SOS response-associated peptidase YedK